MADNNVVMEEREEMMVSPSSNHIYLRNSHFLKPSVTSIDGPVVAPSLSCSAPCRLAEYKNLPLKVNYHGWRSKEPPENWKIWANQMRSLHNQTWKRNGIHDAIMASTRRIHRYDELIFGFVEKWCPNTNSFVFPWGEATITLEDVMVLGGYSVLGESVLIRPRDDETMKKLHKARSSIIQSKARKADPNRWIVKFMGSGSEIEHEAFLAYWLSRFVFALYPKAIGTHIFSIAVHLARGIRIALAPAVLAAIYKSLSHLKASVVAARKSATNEGGNRVVEVTVSAQLGLVQVWIWERFTSLRPKPISVGENEARLARWHNLKLLSEYRSLTIDSSGKDFVWRPYVENECWAKVDGDVDEDLETFVRCVRPSELVSLEENCIEHYMPHRVSMQFGMDQDLPGHVSRVNVNAEIAWRDYTRPISDVKPYVPPPLFEPCVTTRYSKWWKKLNLSWNGKTLCEESKVEVKKELFGMKLEADFLPPPPGFSPKRKRVEETGSSGKAQRFQVGEKCSSKRHRGSVERADCNDSYTPPAKHSQVQSSNGNNDGAQGNNGNIREEMVSVRPVESEVGCTLTKEAYTGTTNKKIGAGPAEVRCSRSGLPGIEIEEKLRNIEKLCALIKAGRISLPSMKISKKPDIFVKLF